MYLQLLRRCKSYCVEEKRVFSRESVVVYVMGNMLSQGKILHSSHVYGITGNRFDHFSESSGQHFFCKRLAGRIAAGAWCCGCFFLVQIYCSTLTSHLTSPNQKLLVNSFFEIADKPVRLSVNRPSGLDKLLQVMATFILISTFFKNSKEILTLADRTIGTHQTLLRYTKKRWQIYNLQCNS